MQFRELTKAEEEIMRVLWQLEKAFVKDVITELPVPKPAYTTVSTIIRILEKKGMVGYTAFGKTHEYFPLISEADYRKFQTEQLMTNYFDNSLKKLVSFFVTEKNLTITEANEIIDLLNQREP
jgi:BlaI family transcriptional regulator, penicillinase repressor